MDDEAMDNDAVTVPIAIDSVKHIETYNMTRCTYFSIENSAPAPGWTLSLQDINIAFIMMDLSGVITSPPGASRFDNPDHLDRLFEVVEQKEELYVDTNDIWIPNALFNRSGGKIQRGDVYRIGFDLFRVAFMLKEEARSDEEFLRRMRHLNTPEVLEFSIDETAALRDWNERQIDINKAYYHDNPQKKLPKKDNYQKPLPPLTETE